ncbi:hypothetical protein H072_7158 [Dactylellina haptotyla CBS 200.50]|uniref:Uncharacterized protein n=1 Tax=Dactylellina haptotyla (strain CBS 200.50) TaxID=1284197 RepID=S8BIC2_DACHA|nr:hypothetical protein H072_7158 [Dactylellina haptotyla CBS 200.50]
MRNLNIRRRSLIPLLISISVVRPWMLELTFSGDSGNSTRSETFEQIATNQTMRLKGIPTHTNECVDTWTAANFVDIQYLSGSRDPSEISDQLIEYNFHEGVVNQKGFSLYLYNDTVCEGLTPAPGTDTKGTAFDAKLNSAHRVYDLSGPAGTTLKRPRKVRSFYVETELPRQMDSTIRKGHRPVGMMDDSA